ncbi:MAG TPA: type IX secretion system sortase PorU, partial [Parasegetibacter sp.]
FAHRLKTEYSAFSTGENTSLELLFNPGSFNAQGWLSRVTVHGRCQLNFSGQSQFGFREFSGVGPGLFQQFSIAGSPASAQVWDVTNPFEPVRMQGTLNSNSFQFRNDASVLREYVAFTGESFFTPHFVGKVENQNLHAPATPQMLIVTEKSLLPAAQQLASLHQEKDQLESLVVTTEQIFNEFSSGSPDPTAIRNFVKMFYDRAGTDTTLRPKYLLLFGDGSYDYKDRLQGNSNLVPAYQTAESLDPLTTYTSDDYFGFLDDDEDINAPNKLNILDIGIGRIPARNLTEARAMVEKIRTYMSNTSLGPWRNEVIFVADDEDQNLHLEDAEAAAQSLYSNNPTFHPSKIYLDAFLQQSAPGGSRYPDVNRLNNSKITNGTLVWNYNGHGGNRRLAEEVVLDESLLNEWNNAGRNPLLITATCDFAPFDNPSVFSLGEKALLMEKNGAIALMTTTRLVFASSNRVMNSNYLKVAFTRNSDGAYLTLGEAVKEAKNFTYLTSTDIVNNRKFMLLGDPALRLAFPKHQVKTTSINGKAVGANNDTLRAFNKYQIEAEVTDYSGNFLSGFNGTAHVVVYDKPANLTTRGNDPGSIPVEFTAENNIIYKGQSTIKDGRFTCSFIVPGDINFSFDKGSIYYYVEDGQTDGNSVYRNIIVGGVGENSGDDKTGPEIKAWLNDESFVNGSITNENPVLYLKLIDSSGINISGTGIGHDLVAILDENIEKPFVLNAFYEASKDSYQEGMVRFQFNGLEPGFHRLRIRAWDVVNNSSEITLEFQVVSKEELSVKRVLNYPNPFTTQTSFWFEHNRPAEDLQVQIRIFSISGKLVKTLQNTINSPGFRSSQVTWDGRDEYGQKLARGVYIYILTVRSADGNRSEIIEKLVIL